jgi:hypothetical protein
MRRNRIIRVWSGNLVEIASRNRLTRAKAGRNVVMERGQVTRLADRARPPKPKHIHFIREGEQQEPPHIKKAWQKQKQPNNSAQ